MLLVVPWTLPRTGALVHGGMSGSPCNLVAGSIHCWLEGPYDHRMTIDLVGRLTLTQHLILQERGPQYANRLLLKLLGMALSGSYVERMSSGYQLFKPVFE